MIVTWSETRGGYTLPYRVVRQGKKQIPFDKTIKPEMAYYMSQMILDEVRSLGPLNGQVGAGLWGNVEPAHVCVSGFDSKTLTFTTQGNFAYARAYNKFKDKIFTQAANLTALAERVKTVDMVFARLQQLHKGAKALKSGRFKEFLRTFGIRPLKKHENTRWTRPKQFGQLWLEYWMGWAPTVGDVYNSIDALSRRVPDQTIRAGSSVPINNDYSRTSGATKSRSNYSGTGTVWIQAKVIVTNPSLHIAQTLGLINPAKTLWETIGFSWLVDWFTNVGQILGQVTDWVGLQLTNMVVSVKTEVINSWSCQEAHLVYGPAYPRMMFCSRSYLWFSRYVTNTLPVIKPIFRLPNGLSLSRGATLASLLATMFAPSRR